MKKWLDRYDGGGQTPARDNTTVYHNRLPIAGPKLPAPSYISATPDYKDSEWYKQESEDYKTRRNITQPILHAADVTTDIMQLGRFIPLPQAQAIGTLGSELGLLIDSYQAADAYANNNYVNSGINAASTLIPLYMSRTKFLRDMHNTKPGSLADKIASYGNRSGTYLPLSGIRPNLIKNLVMRKAINQNKKTLLGLAAETAYDSYAEGGESMNAGWLDRYDKGGPTGKKLSQTEVEDIRNFAANVSKNSQNYIANKNTKGTSVNLTDRANIANTPGVNYNAINNQNVTNTFNQQQNAFDTFWHSPEGQTYQYNLAIKNDELAKREARQNAIKSGSPFREVPQFGPNGQMIPSDPSIGIPIPDAAATGIADPLNWPLYLATGNAAVKGLGLLGEAAMPALANVAPYIEAPLTFGKTVIPGVTPGSVTAAYFANEGIKKLPETQASIINAYRNPTASNIISAATDAGWNTMDFLGTGEAVKGATELISPVVNKVGEALGKGFANVKKVLPDNMSSDFIDAFRINKLNKEYSAVENRLGDRYDVQKGGLYKEESDLGNDIRQKEWEIKNKLQDAQKKLTSTKLNAVERQNLVSELHRLDDLRRSVEIAKKEYKVVDKNTLFKVKNSSLANVTEHGSDAVLDFNTLQEVPVYVKPPGETKVFTKDIKNKSLNIQANESVLPEVSENLPAVHTSNIEYIEKAAPGSKVFGSSRGVSEAGFNHLTKDYDALISRDNYDKFVKNKYNALNETGTAKTHDILEGKGIKNGKNHGAVDFVIVEKNAAGKATGKRAQELYRQFDPEGYQKAVKEFMEKNKNKISINSEDFENGLNIPYTPDELISKVNPKIKTIMDSYEINVGNIHKVKHTNRIDAYINYGDPNAVIEAQDKFVKSLVGNKGTTGHNFNVNAFDNYENNLEVLKEIDFAGDVNAVARNPKRMQAALNDYYIHQTTLSRGVNRYNNNLNRNLSMKEIDKAFKEWDPDAGGGQVMGAGQNHVSLGESGSYELYGHKQVNLGKLNTSDPLSYVKDIKYKTSGDAPFSNSEKKLVEDLFTKYGLNINDYNPIKNGEDLILSLSGKNNVNKKILEEFADATGKKIVMTGQYSQSNFASTLKDFDETMDALSYSFTEHTVIPKSKYQRDAALKAGNATTADPKTIAEFNEHLNVAQLELKKIQDRINALRWRRTVLSKQDEDILNIAARKVFNKRYPGKMEEYNRLNKELVELSTKSNVLHARIYRAKELQKLLKIVTASALGFGSLSAAAIYSYKKDRERWDKKRWDKNSKLKSKKYEYGGSIHNWREVEVPHTKNQLSGWLDKL